MSSEEGVFTLKVWESAVPGQWLGTILFNGMYYHTLVESKDSRKEVVEWAQTEAAFHKAARKAEANAEVVEL